MFEDIMLNLIPIISVVCVFLFLSTVVWAKQRRRERDAYYRHELAKTMVTRGADADEVARMLRKSRSSLAERREGLKLGGLLTFAIGIGFMIGFQWIPADLPIWKIGFVPTLLGAAMVTYSVLADSDSEPDPS
jgi:hypothetical protein